MSDTMNAEERAQGPSADTESAQNAMMFERIWLHAEVSGSWYDWTWCQDQIDEYDTEYIRADIVEERVQAGRSEGLEEAAQVAEEHAFTNKATPYAGGELNSIEICNKIRALKDG